MRMVKMALMRTCQVYMYILVYDTDRGKGSTGSFPVSCVD